uniref:ATP synthase complex subunit 8 n=1 Tax=Tritoma metasobrina TaxID=2866208 RepID=A0A8F9RU04_9CUCU|nr:ATP synthase subunit 8 [Tritoma metasobrina]
MPQMAPMSWLMLFFYFFVIFMLVNTMVYFSFIYPVKTVKSFKTPLKISWKW